MGSFALLAWSEQKSKEQKSWMDEPVLWNNENLLPNGD